MSNKHRPPRSATGVSASFEDYLETILVLAREQGESVRVTDLSESMGVSKPSVSAAVKRMAEAGLVDHERYGDVRLTPAGLRRAQEVASRHELLHRFLVEVLGVDETTAQQDACRLEHDLSPISVERLTRLVAFLTEGCWERSPECERCLARGKPLAELVDESGVFLGAS